MKDVKGVKGMKGANKKMALGYFWIFLLIITLLSKESTQNFGRVSFHLALRKKLLSPLPWQTVFISLSSIVPNKLDNHVSSFKAEHRSLNNPLNNPLNYPLNNPLNLTTHLTTHLTTANSPPSLPSPAPSA